jgi:hypothetical protein
MNHKVVADWVSVHGNAAVSDASFPVVIANYSGEAVVAPNLATEHWSRGVVHFPLPSAPSGNHKPIRLLADFETAMTVVQRVEIYSGGSEIYGMSLTDDETLECLNLSSVCTQGVQEGRCGHGINVTITLKYLQKNSQATFRSVGMVFSR